MTAHPHLGNLISNYLIKNRITRAECARRMHVKPSEITQYLSRPSLQFHVLWNFCMSLQHDFLSDIIARYPANFPTAEDPRIAEMQDRISIYKELLTGRA